MIAVPFLNLRRRFFAIRVQTVPFTRVPRAVRDGTSLCFSVILAVFTRPRNYLQFKVPISQIKVNCGYVSPRSPKHLKRKLDLFSLRVDRRTIDLRIDDGPIHTLRNSKYRQGRVKLADLPETVTIAIANSSLRQRRLIDGCKYLDCSEIGRLRKDDCRDAALLIIYFFSCTICFLWFVRCFDLFVVFTECCVLNEMFVDDKA